MKHIYLLLLFATSITFAQIPSSYYDSAEGLSGFTLKTELKNITSIGHTSRSYSQLYDGDGISGSNGYEDTHSDVNVAGGTNYENDGTVLDFYSENPTGSDPYNFTHGNEQCGNQSSEGDCYNREHLIPQSSFNSGYPMQSDIHHIIPTDGRVNNFRGSYPFGDVGATNWTSQNGSKRGASAMAGYSGTVFEPIDEFKGDIARAILYFATRYEDTIDGYTSFDMFNGTNNQVFFPWAIDVLLDWHYNVDPVDQRERDRNDAAYNFQSNANPFVDHPEYANMIWNPTPDTEAPSTPTNVVASNPTDNSVFLSWNASTDNIGVATYDIYIDGDYAFNSNNTTATATGLSTETEYCFTLIAKDAAGNESGFSNQDCETTTNNGTIGGSECLAETFENIGESASSYLDVSWTGDNGLIWTATEARTDLSIVDRVITIDTRSNTSGTLTSPAISGGIGELTVTTQRQYSGSTGNLDLYINGDLAGQIPYETTPLTTTILALNIEGNITVEISGIDGDRVSIDDLSWTCYTNLSVEDFNTHSVKLHPNPVKNSLTVGLESSLDTNIEIYDILGKRVFKNTISKTSTLNLQALKTGIYIVKVTQGNSTITKKLVKQ